MEAYTVFRTTLAISHRLIVQMGLYVKAAYSQSTGEKCFLACFASGEHAGWQTKKSAGHLSFAQLVISPSPPTITEERSARFD